ncbi:hypothetical protein ABIB75_005927 [Bradyrhizobium sp. GM2.2]|uniref:hypothetical protein n=1 Tax=unclassified Bradyrhizobium TaxID=2631580 RepID=UPI001FFBE9EA|nr:MULTISPECIES: hypothetical protein [unclassified Bradyrhizobium]MCK1291924.1 hypothetical protein [Bradyrhizobium sp. 30]MCK1309519.1 hypothetical protein [Bradyrhizobium sp. 45]MCK1332645.1 hypothetical protein [Bradyrhizobium sp. CW9]MCK1349271.1 hypothetical protein [Bradyrhizobium sp. CW11]MCK1353865.1 hypothetical protein [Bradyrhizobium sp. CW7]
MRRRDFKTLVSGAALACPLMAGVQQQKQVFRIGFLETDGGTPFSRIRQSPELAP